MISENDENRDELSQLPDYAPNKQISQESTQQSWQSRQSGQCSQSNRCFSSSIN